MSEFNPKKFMVSGRDVYQIAWEMCRQIQVWVLAKLTESPGAQDLTRGYYFQTQEDGSYIKTNYPDQFEVYPNFTFPYSVVNAPPARLPLLNTDGSVADVTVTAEPGLVGKLLTCETAKDILRECARDAVKTIVEALVKRGLECMQGRRDGNGYRHLFMAEVTKAAGKKALASAGAKLAAVVKRRQRRRIGVQYIQTRKPGIPLGWSTFSGMPCFRAPRGRPALPASVWLARYKARLRKRNKTGRHRKGKGVTVPTLESGAARPKRIMNLGHRQPSNMTFYESPDPDAIVALVTSGADEIFA